MIEFLRAIQLDIMLVLSGITVTTAFFMSLVKTLTRERKLYLMLTEIGACLLLVSDRFAYIYRGDVTTAGYWMVRISNFMVYAMVLFIVWTFNRYISVIFKNDAGISVIPIRLRYADYAVIIGLLFLIFSQFTGFYYTFDGTNHYQRSPGFAIGMLIPLSILVSQMSVIIQFKGKISKGLFTSLMLFTTLPVVSAFIQLYAYGLSVINITLGILTVLLYIFAIIDLNQAVDRARKIEIDYLTKEREGTKRLFEQTAEALASAIDAKDKYTKGHSSRVAEYSRKIARTAGKDDRECEEIYYAALLHDVGKIGISNSILNKEGRLTDLEYERVKQHPEIGSQILSRISESPYLSIGALHHHERYDGKGYPKGLKGEDIPEIARIIAVADAYDAMTSNRSYRSAIPQQMVREEFVKSLGSQFDPVFGNIMLHLIDIDSEYLMKEKEEIRELAGKDKMRCEEYGSAVSEGIPVISGITKIHLSSRPLTGYADKNHIPSLILFDSLDARIHDDDMNRERLLYFEYGIIRFDGKIICKGARKMQPKVLDHAASSVRTEPGGKTEYDISAVRINDHALIKIDSPLQTSEIVIAMPDSTRYLYLGLTGDHCEISDVHIDREDTGLPEDYIPRIAEKISYIDAPEGDMPNIQIDGYRSAASDGIPVTDGLRISFHTMSLPTARLVWHCPFISIFSSDDGKIQGPNFREYALIRIDGENWESEERSTNELIVSMTAEFKNWDNWKVLNKEGLDCTFSFKVNDGKITAFTENAGISIKNTTVIEDETRKVYAALTGDQCAITNIRIEKEE
ncbi:MAG: HD domain-containing protein [Clostridiales bacterium]|nr:HD domain-containing protein [Clostridiales bacterium]